MERNLGVFHKTKLLIKHQYLMGGKDSVLFRVIHSIIAQQELLTFFIEEKNIIRGKIDSGVLILIALIWWLIQVGCFKLEIV